MMNRTVLLFGVVEVVKKNLYSYLITTSKHPTNIAGYNIRKFHIFIALSILYGGFIFYLSSQSVVNISPESFLLGWFIDFAKNNIILSRFIEIPFFVDIAHYSYDNFDKIAHIFLYFGLGILLHITFRHSDNNILKKYAPIFAIFLGIAYGITDEIHQMYVPGRTSSVADLMADGIGVTLAQIVFWIILFKALLFSKKGKDPKNSQ